MTRVTERSHRKTPPLARQAVSELMAHPTNLPLLWGRRGMWQTKLRWVVAPLMIAGLGLGRLLGFELPVLPIVAIAAASLIYNAVFAWVFTRHADRLRSDPQLDRMLTMIQIAADYAAIFVLIHYTGGAWSPVTLFLIFHVIIAAIQFSPANAYLLAALAAAGLWLLWLGQWTGWLPEVTVSFRGQPFPFAEGPAHTAVMLVFFTVTLFTVASMISAIMRRLRDRVADLAQASSELAQANHKLKGLYSIVRTISAERHIEPILNTVVSELARVLGIPAVAVKLLEDDEQTLRCVASHGLSEDLAALVIRVDRSPINRRILAGETLVHGHVEGDEDLPLQNELSALGIRSAALAPLRGQDRIIGTLGIYSDRPDDFDVNDADFLKLTAELVAIAVEDARTSERLEALMRERTQFMLEVAHNLRAPLGASLGIVELLTDKYLGPINQQQLEYLERIDARLRSLHRTIGELLTIARTRDWSREIPDVVVDLTNLASHTERTFRAEADAKQLSFTIDCDPDLPPIDSGADLLEQVMENLVSNAIKYTPEKGQVAVRFSKTGADRVRIEVRDNGIGIPEREQKKLFSEFFRATNAKKHTREGTGLGLTLVKQTVERHGGELSLDSSEGGGTRVTIELPLRQAKRKAH